MSSQETTPGHDDILTLLLGLCCEVAAGTADASTVRDIVEKLNAQGLGPAELPVDCDGNLLGSVLAREIGIPWDDPDGPREYVVRLRWHDIYGDPSDETGTFIAYSPMDAARRCFMRTVPATCWSRAGCSVAIRRPGWRRRIVGVFDFPDGMD
mgnify:CR=1 FL=1